MAALAAALADTLGQTLGARLEGVLGGALGEQVAAHLGAGAPVIEELSSQCAQLVLSGKAVKEGATALQANGGTLSALEPPLSAAAGRVQDCLLYTSPSPRDS